MIGVAAGLLAACGGSGSAPTPAPTVSLSAAASSVVSGSTTTLTWRSTNATACTASQGWSGAQATSGSLTTSALTANTSYTLTCTGPGGSADATAAVTVTVPPPPPLPVVALTANPVAVASGAASTLTWSSTDATTCTAAGGWSGTRATNGTASTGALTATTQYTLVCSNATGSTTAAATVTYLPPPTVALTASPPGVVSGGAATLVWSSTNASSCTASGGWTGTEATSGTASTGAISATTAYVLTCTGPGGSAGASATATLTNPASFPVTPRTAALTLSQAQQFTAAVPGGGVVTWSVDGQVGGSATVGTVSAQGLYTPPATPGTHALLATSTANPAQSGAAAVAVTDLTGVTTFHNDLARTGQNLHEYALTPATVAGGGFGLRWSCTVDGDVYAQPLYVANLPIGGATHNVLFVATEHDSVYAFDADLPNCTTYWQITTLANGATTIPPADTNFAGNDCTDIPQEYGITGTPVIDPANGTLYVVANSKENGSHYQRLHALRLATGAEQTGSPVTIQASVTNAANAAVVFSPLWQNQRPGLALYDGNVVIGWASHCDNNTWNGWLMSYDETTLTQTAAFTSTPNGTDGGIWMSAGAPAVDAQGSLYVTTGNGTFNDTADALPPTAPNSDFSMSFLKLNPVSLTVQDFYTPTNEARWSASDYDISSSGVTVLPDGIGPAAHPNLLVGSDKQAHLWLLDRSALGEYSSTLTGNAVQYLTLPNAPTCLAQQNEQCVYDTPAYYDGTVYIGMSWGSVMALPLTDGVFGASAQGIATVSSMSTETYDFPGPTPMISASPAGGALLWVLDNSAYQDNPGGAAAGPAILRAYAAGSLGTTVYSSATLAADAAGKAVKFTVPVIANGHVYVGGSHQLTVYGLSP